MLARDDVTSATAAASKGSPAARRLWVFRLHRFTIAVIVVLAVCVWWTVAPPIPEGPVLLRVSESHGLDASDLPTLVVLAGLAWAMWHRRWRGA